jgi:branched-chain amino acid transport system permease protein
LTEFLQLTVIGLVTSAAYAIAASGLVVTYATSGVFNFAHGAIGMLMAYLYWQCIDGWHWPVVGAFVFVIFLVAPLLGAALEFGVVRWVSSKSPAISAVITIGLLLLIIGLAEAIWGGGLKPAPAFFGAHGWHLATGVFVTWHETITVLTAAGLAVGLRILLFSTRLGIAMRAMVDQRDLVALHGARVAWISTFSWAVGAATASLAGLLIAPVLDDLSVLPLTFLVIYAYGAAVLGRLRSLPLTFAGALVLGLSYAYLIGYLPQNSFFGSATVQGLRGSVPVVLLFTVLLVTRQESLPGWRVQSWGPSTRVSSGATSLVAGALFVAVTALVAHSLSAGALVNLSTGLAEAIIVLSLVPLTGWAGQLSLCQMTFAGLGAFSMAHVGGGGPAGLCAAVGLAGVVGAVIALPALRLRGLYLALSTFAFALAMDNMFFSTSASFGSSGSMTVPRVHLLWLHVGGDRAYAVFLTATFVALAVGLLVLRRGSLGRLLIALKDSEAACTTLGLNRSRVKLTVFALSAAIAGLGGALYGGVTTRASGLEFSAIQSLPVLLLGVVGGLATTSGAFVGGFSLGLLGTKIQAILPGVPNVSYDVTGVAGTLAGYLPDGIVPFVGRHVRRLARFLRAPTGT